MKTLLLSLFIAASALGQPVVSLEITSAPIENLDDYAIAPQRDGFVFVWTAGGRLYAARLDAALHIVAAPLVLPLSDSAAEAVRPAIASDGKSVLVAWHERRAGYGETAYVALLSGDAQALLKGPQPMNITKDGPLATSVDGKYVVYTGDLRYVFNEDLDTEAGQFIARNLGAALAEDGGVATVSESSSGHFDCRQICFGKPCAGPPTPCDATSTVTFRFGETTSTFNYAFRIPADTLSTDPFLTWPPAVAPNGDSYAGLVHLPNTTDVFFPNPLRRITVPVPVLGQTALAGNGSDVLLVWTSPQLMGIIVRADGSVSEPFPIADSGSQPRVVSVNSNEFAVLYRIDAAQGASAIAGRIVQLQAPRRRGVR